MHVEPAGRQLGDTLRAFFGWCDSIIRRVARWLTQRFSKTTKDTLSQPSNMPPIYLHPHADANEPVTLHEGPIAVQGGMTGTGRLVLHWQPSTGLRLEADMDSMNAPQPGARLSVDVAGSTAEVLFSSLRIGMGAAGHFARVSGSVSGFTKGQPPA